MAMTGGSGEIHIGYEPYVSGDEKLARAGIVKVSSEEAVGMTAAAFLKAVAAMRTSGRGKEAKDKRLDGTAKVVLGLAVGTEAHRRSVRKKLGL